MWMNRTWCLKPWLAWGTQFWDNLNNGALRDMSVWTFSTESMSFSQQGSWWSWGVPTNLSNQDQLQTGNLSLWIGGSCMFFHYVSFGTHKTNMWGRWRLVMMTGADFPGGWPWGDAPCGSLGEERGVGGAGDGDWSCDRMGGVRWDNVENTFYLKLTQLTTPIAKFRVFFDTFFCVERWTSLGEKKHENTIPSIPPRHHRNTANTPQKDPKSSDTVKTLRTHHQSATKTPTTSETKLTDHQDTSMTDTANPEKTCKGCFPKTCYRHTLSWYCFHHLLASPSTQHRHDNIITAAAAAAAPPPASSSSSSSSSSPSSSPSSSWSWPITIIITNHPP